MEAVQVARLFLGIPYHPHFYSCDSYLWYVRPTFDLEIFQKRKNQEILHLAFQDSLEEARRIQAQAVTAKNEVQRLARAVALQRAKLRAAPASAPSVPRSPKTKGVTLPTIIVNASG